MKSRIGVAGKPRKDEPIIRLGQSDVYVRHRYILPLQCIAAGWSWTETAQYLHVSEPALVNGIRQSHSVFQDLRRSGVQQFALKNGITPIQDSPPHVPRQGLIYAVSFSYCDELVKIGKTSLERLNHRLKSYKTAHCQQACSARLLSIELVSYNKVKAYERCLRQQFEALSYKGSEWFYVQDHVEKYLSQTNPQTLFEIHQTLSPQNQEFFQPCLF